jgi:uncharacterized membrane protein YphA (DoxX/SURF4 family)
MHKILLPAARYVVGILFIISGLIKVNDPVGTQIKLEEYFEVFASDISGVFHVFVPWALFLSVFLSVLEVVLGVALLVRFKMKLTTTVLLVMIVFFTFLTFYSAYFNKVTDCGCFGDALKLTPWQSFMKDLVLLVLILYLFIYRNKFKRAGTGTDTLSGAVVGGTLVLCIGIAWYAIEHLPYIDFRAYKQGNNIGQLMQPSEPFRYSYVMMKDGKEYEFDQYPAATEGYEYKEIKLLNPEAQPVITDFGMWNNEGDFSEQVLQGNKLLVVIHTVEKTEQESLAAIKQLAATLGNEVETIAVTSSNEADFDAFRHENQLAIPYYFGDATLLKTMIRSNPGLILLQDGTVKEKWHFNDIPEATAVREGLK